MSRRITTLQDASIGINRDIGSKYDKVKTVAENIGAVLVLADNLDNTLKYLGAGVTPPGTRLDGSPIQDGDYYFNTVDGSEAVTYYDLSNTTWFAIDPAVILAYTERAETATTGAEASAVAAAISAGNIGNAETNSAASAAAALVSEGNASASETNAGASETQTVLDAAATALDKIATNADVVITNAAVITTNTDAVQTGLDRTQTAANTTQTGLDKVQTALDAVSTASDRSAIETLYDTFDDRFLGTKAADPLVDNDGDPLLIGATYFNSTLNHSKFYNGAAWEDPKATATQAALTATTKAGEASTSASNALTSESAAIASAGNASTSEINAGNSASAAATSEGNTSTSETNAATSESNASTSEGNAATSATSASDEADRAQSISDNLGIFKYATPKADFYSRADLAMQTSEGDGDNYREISFDDFYDAPATVANELTLKARSRKVMGIDFDVQQITLTLPEASAVSTLLSNQVLIMFETNTLDVTAGNNFYPKGNLHAAPVVWSGLSESAQTAYLQDFTNNTYSDNGNIIQATYKYVITNLTKDYSVWDWEQAVLDAGYTQGIVNSTVAQWTKTGGIVANPISLVQLRNQGAYHPSFNPNGCAFMGQTGNTNLAANWHYIGAQTISSAFEAFTWATIALGYTGVVGDASSSRPDGKFFDAVYPTDIKDLRLSSVTVSKAELENMYFEDAKAGRVRGFEGVPFTSFATITLGDFNSSGYAKGVLGSPATHLTFLNGGTYETLLHTSGILEPLFLGDYLVSPLGHIAQVTQIVNASSISINMIIGDGSDLGHSNILYQVKARKQLHSSFKSTRTDIIAYPADIEALFTTVGSKFFGAEGMEGQWIPILTVQPLSLNRKSLTSSSNRTYSIDGGVTWTNDILLIDTLMNKTANTGAGGGIVQLVNYETQSHFTQDDMGVTRLTDWKSMVRAVNNNAEAILTSSLVGVVATGTDPSEELSINKIMSEVITHTAQTLTADVLYTVAIGYYNYQLYLMFNCDDTGVIDSTNIKVVALPYFYKAD